MELLKANYLNTTTMLTLDSETVSASNIFNPRKRVQYVTDGFNSDLTTTTIKISFDSTLAVSRIGLINMNWKDFTVYYNGLTASTFALTTTAATTVSDFSSNSETSMYMIATSVNCTSVSFDVTATQVADVEKAIGYIYVGALEYELARIPSAKNYKPKLESNEIVHKMSDGGVRVQKVDEKWSASISFKHIDLTFRNSLKRVWDLDVDLAFVPFGTTTAWDGILFTCRWTGPFEFYTHSDNAVDAGFEGKIPLMEVSS